MTAWTTISGALVAVGAKPFATTVQALRDNPVALGEKDTTVPLNLRLGKWLLGTIATTSGTSLSLGSLDLTHWTSLECVISGVSTDNSGSALRIGANNRTISNSLGSSGSFWNGFVEIDLATGVAASIVAIDANGTSPIATAVSSGLSNASTSVTFSIFPGNFDAGSIAIYGVR
jgi:hypothetical protein